MKPLVLSMGDAAGIGPEIILQAWAREPQDLAGCVVLGDLAVMQRALAVTGLGSALRLSPVPSLEAAAGLPAS